MRIKWIPALLMMGALIGCATKIEQVPVEVTKSVYHPNRPSPVEPFSPKWKVIVDENGKSFVSMSYSDSVRYRIWLEDVKRYIQSQNSIICGYRTDLNESECK